MSNFYYIMDYNGNYYRIGENDQLVTADAEENADLFTFAQANGRVCNKMSTYCMVPVVLDSDESDEDEDEYENEGENEQREEEDDTSDEDAYDDEDDDYFSPDESVKDEVGGIIYINGHTTQTGEQPQIHLVTLKNLIKAELEENFTEEESAKLLADMDWAGYLEEFIRISSAVKAYHDILSQKHSEIDKKICDILHYIELYKPQPEEAAELVTLLSICREKRRKIKNDLICMDSFRANFGTNANITRATTALKSIQRLDNRVYLPRQYQSLFENCTGKGDEIISDLRGSFYHNQDKQEAVQIMGERIHTPLDEKENDWISFAQQQAEFYKNVSQYITNLRLDIKGIDDQIENILSETETVRCNTTQGYKFFKQLQDLRIVRKQKSKELDCLNALTEHIDCDNLSSAYEDSLIKVETILGVQTSNKSNLNADENINMAG